MDRGGKGRRVIDATHPFAVRATQTIRACADALHIPYVRIERAADCGARLARRGDVGRQFWRRRRRWPRSARENILLTTGSHTLSVYAKVIEPERLFVRVLPTHQALDLCAAAGMVQSHVIAMQGPFFAGFQRGALRSAPHPHDGVKRDSGQPGGVADKVLPRWNAGSTW